MPRILELRREKANLLGYRDFADLVLEDRMAHTGERAQRVSGGSEAQDRGAFPAARTPELPAFAGKPNWSPGTSPITPKSSAPRSTISMRKPCGPISRWRAWCRGCSRSCSGCTEFAWWKSRRSGVGSARQVLRDPRRRIARQHVDGRLLRGLVSAREQARRRLDGRAHHRGIASRHPSSRTPR